MIALNRNYSQEISKSQDELELTDITIDLNRDASLSDTEYLEAVEEIESRRRRLRARIPTASGKKLDILYTNDANQKLIDDLIGDPLAGVSNTPLNLPGTDVLPSETLPYLHYEEISFDYLRAKAEKLETYFEERILQILFPDKEKRKLVAKIHQERGIGQWDSYEYYHECQQTKALVLIRRYLVLDKDKLSPQLFFWLLNEFPWLIDCSCFQEFCKVKITVCVELPGKFCRDLTPIEQIRLAQKLNELGFKARRIDIKCDFPKELGVFDNYLEYSQNESISKIKGWSYHESNKNGLDKFRTIELGSRKSGKFIRIYEKPFDDIIVDRFEGEFKGNDALGLWEAIIGFTSDKTFTDNQGIDLQKFLARILFHLKVPYDEVTKRKNGQTTKIVYPEWFTNLLQRLDALVPIKYVVPRPEKCISSTFQWIIRISKTLYKYFVSCPDFLQDCLNLGEKKLKSPDKTEMKYLESVLPDLREILNSSPT